MEMEVMGGRKRGGRRKRGAATTTQRFNPVLGNVGNVNAMCCCGKDECTRGDGPACTLAVEHPPLCCIRRYALGTDKMDSKTLRTSDLPHQCDNNSTMFTCWCLPQTYQAMGRCLAQCRQTGPCAFGRHWMGSCHKNWGGHAAGSSDPWVAATGVSVWGSATQWNCLDSLQTHTCTRTPTTPQTGAVVTLHPILAQWDQYIDGGTQFDMPRVWTACPANIEGILRMQVIRKLLQQCCPSYFCIRDFGWWR
jgi:hypothetical protein